MRKSCLGKAVRTTGACSNRSAQLPRGNERRVDGEYRGAVGVREGIAWRIAVRELPTGLTLGSILGVIGFIRIELWQRFHLFNYGAHHFLLALTVGVALIGIVSFGSLAGSMLPFVHKRLGFDPATASAPFVATLVVVTGLVIYFSVAVLLLRGTLL